jgi:hypothetical protein
MSYYSQKKRNAHIIKRKERIIGHFQKYFTDIKDWNIYAILKLLGLYFQRTSKRR